ncbi:hypothetical protein AVEN_21714-1, partial [Araneus ventricosus]
MVLPRVLQINVNHSRAGHGSAFVFAEEQNFDVVCVQDPYIIDGFPLGDALGNPVFSSKSCNLLVGDFNARPQIWGYGFEDHRGRVISEFISTNNFYICNRTDLGPTFVSSTGQSSPDLTLISSVHQHLLDFWWIDDKESLSDH